MATLAVVPAFNEEDLIGDTVESLHALEEIDRVVVVDDASGDGTAGAARDAGATVVVNGANLGKGGSLNRLIPLLEFDVLVLIDGDLGVHARQAGRLLAPVLAGDADIAIAAFPPPTTKGGFGFAQGTGGAGIERLTGTRMKSPLSGQRAMTRGAWLKVSPFDPGFGMEVGMTVDALRCGLRVVEVPTEMSHRETARSFAGFVHRGRQFLAIVRSLAKRHLERGSAGC